ncbi:MAG: DUF2283 domain-containing protein [Patescibacteria group bacterium]|nr:DUF2283 domain-containing protein [Patescibacteria group bacterium]
MRFHYDKEADALYIRFNENPYQKSEEVQEGIIFDYDKKGKMIGIEILDVSRRFPRQFKLELSKGKLPLTLTLESRSKTST